MYGLLLENLAEYVKTNYGEEKWDDIRRQAGIDSPSFSVHQVYPENLLQKLAKKAQQVNFINTYNSASMLVYLNIEKVIFNKYRYLYDNNVSFLKYFSYYFVHRCWKFPKKILWIKWVYAL